MRYVTSLLLVGLAMSPACKKKNEGGDMGSGSGSGSGVGSGSGSAMVGSAGAGSDIGSGSGSDLGSGSAGATAGSAGSGAAAAGSALGESQMAHHAGNCPSTVLGSTTKAEIKGKDVVVSITAGDADAVKAIQKRTDELLGAKKTTAGVGMGHDQKGMHGGGMGLCPVYVPEGAKATAKHDKQGVTVTIVPKDKPDALKTEVDARIQRAADWVKSNIKPGDRANEGGVGGGSGNDGMNHSGSGDAKGIERKRSGDSSGGGKGTGGGGGKGTGGGTSKTK